MARGMHKGPKSNSKYVPNNDMSGRPGSNGNPVRSRVGTSSLERRQATFDGHGKNPAQNPSNSSGTGHDMHRPGSNKK